MNQSEAKLYFKYENNDELLDLWEERFFEQKQFFLTRTPINKVFYGRLKKLHKQYEAYLALSETADNTKPITWIKPKVDFTNVVIEAFNQLHKFRTQIKQFVLQSNNPKQLQDVIDYWLSVEFEYINKWSNPITSLIEEDVVISKEPDPMDLIKSLNEWDENKPPKKTFEELILAYSFLPKRLQLEVKRLTLLKSKWV